MPVLAALHSTSAVCGRPREQAFGLVWPFQLWCDRFQLWRDRLLLCASHLVQDEFVGYCTSIHTSFGGSASNAGCVWTTTRTGFQVGVTVFSFGVTVLSFGVTVFSFKHGATHLVPVGFVGCHYSIHASFGRFAFNTGCLWTTTRTGFQVGVDVPCFVPLTRRHSHLMSARGF